MNRIEVDELSNEDDAEATIVVEVIVPEEQADEVEKKIAKKLGGHKKVRQLRNYTTDSLSPMRSPQKTGMMSNREFFKQQTGNQRIGSGLVDAYSPKKKLRTQTYG